MTSVPSKGVFISHLLFTLFGQQHKLVNTYDVSNSISTYLLVFRYQHSLGICLLHPNLTLHLLYISIVGCARMVLRDSYIVGIPSCVFLISILLPQVLLIILSCISLPNVTSNALENKNSYLSRETWDNFIFY